MLSIIGAGSLEPAGAVYCGRYPKYYSTEEQDVVITYTWAMCLLTQLPRFLELIEEELEPVLGRKPRCCRPPSTDLTNPGPL